MSAAITAEMVVEGLPKINQNLEISDIFREYGNIYRSKYSLPLSHLQVMHAIEICRTAYLGGHIDKCDTCGAERNSYNSCRNRHCPKCQTMTKEKWISDRKSELLPVPYFHNVFTLPHDLNPIALYNPKVIYNLLFKSVSETLMIFGNDPRHMGGKLGFTAILHTWDQKLLTHIHLHVVIPAGGLSFDKSRWIGPKKRSKKKFLFHVKALSKTFRGIYMKNLERAYNNGELIIPGDQDALDNEKFNKLKMNLWKKNWIVYSKPPFGGPDKVLEYLGRYTHRVAISNNRIISLKSGNVTYKYRDRKDGNKEKIITINALEFIRRFMLHVLPKGFMKIRHMGFMANPERKKNISMCKEILGGDHQIINAGHINDNETTSEKIKRITGIDLNKCPKCAKGTMVRLMEIINPLKKGIIPDFPIVLYNTS